MRKRERLFMAREQQFFGKTYVEYMKKPFFKDGTYFLKSFLLFAVNLVVPLWLHLG